MSAVSLKYSPLKVHLVECISESHSAVDRRCHTDVDELAYFGNTVKGREELLRPRVTQAHLLLCLCSFSFTLWVKKGAVPAGTLGCPGEGEGGPAATLVGNDFSLWALELQQTGSPAATASVRERGKRGRLTGALLLTPHCWWTRAGEAETLPIMPQDSRWTRTRLERTVVLKSQWGSYLIYSQGPNLTFIHTCQCRVNWGTNSHEIYNYLFLSLEICILLKLYINYSILLWIIFFNKVNVKYSSLVHFLNPLSKMAKPILLAFGQVFILESTHSSTKSIYIYIKNKKNYWWSVALVVIAINVKLG